MKKKTQNTKHKKTNLKARKRDRDKEMEESGENPV